MSCAVSTFSYNSRHLVTSISYNAPAGVAATANATFGYDAAGNRTSMTDGVGSHSYTHNQLSRMTSETTIFTGLSGSYTLSYGYNLAGVLTSLAEPVQFGAVVNYTYDAIGRLAAVTGSGGLSAQLLTGLQYRAWGALKHANYGDGPQLNVTYDARMRATLTQFSNIYLSYPNGGYATMGSENQYHADGRLRYAHDLQDGNFDRAFDYDHAGRLKEAYSGREARGLSPNNPADSPFRQSYTYDAWNNLSRTGRHWTAPVSDTPAYTNNRRADWTYDANGSVTSRDSGQRTHAYDAAGQQRNFYEEGLQAFSGESWVSHQYTINQTYDAAGRAGKRIETRHSEDENGTLEDSTETSYQLRSTVLGGALIVQLDEWGGREGHVYAGGELLADYQYYPAPYTFTSIHHRNPTTGQWVENGIRTELDPLGADVSYVNPYLYNLTYSDIMGADNLYYRRGNALDIRGGCSLNGLSIPCSLANEAIASETGSTAFEYRLNDGTVVGEQGAIHNLGAGLFLFEHPTVKLDNEPGDNPYRLAWRKGSFYLLPQEPSKPTHDPHSPLPNPNPYPGCITGRWLLNNPQIQSIFNEVWQQTAKSGKENGGWMFYEPKTNTIHINSASEGTETSMPNEKTDFANQTRQYQQEGRSVLFIGMFHTHPNGSKYPSSVFGDMDVLAGRNNVKTKGGAPPMGFIIYGSGKYTPYDQDGVLFDVNAKVNGVDINEMTRCL